MQKISLPKLKIFLLDLFLFLIILFVILEFSGEDFEKIDTGTNNKNNIDLNENLKQGTGTNYKINYVVDGDTINIFDKNGEKKSVRMIGIDTPESYKTRFGYKECFGNEAKKHLENLIGDSEEVEIETDETQGEVDRYGRILGYLILNGENLNEKMIKDGFAWEFTYQGNPYKYQENFKNAEKFASENDFGLWGKDTCNGERLKIEE